MIWALPFLLVVGIVLPLLAWSSYRHLASASAVPESLPSPQAMSAQAVAWLAHRLALKEKHETAGPGMLV